MRRTTAVIGGLAAGAVGLLMAVPAFGSVTGPCNGFALVTPQGGGPAVGVDPVTGNGPFEVPLSGSAAYKGYITGVPAGQQSYSGSIVLKLPPGLPDIVVADWSGTTDLTSTNGVYDYDLPAFVPRGVEIPLHGEHTQGGVACTADVTVKVAGSVVGPYTIGTGLMAAGLGAGFVGVGVKPFVKARGVLKAGRSS
jgi:hypothetical protein